MSWHSLKLSAQLAWQSVLDRTTCLLDVDVPTTRCLKAEGLEERVLMSASPAVAVADAPLDSPNAQPSLDEVLQAIAPDGAMTAETADIAAVLTATVEQMSPAAQVRELVFLDPHAADLGRLIEDLNQQRSAGRAIDLVMLDDLRDGIDQISDALSHYTGLEAVHIISHGDGGEVWLGSTRLDLSVLGAYVGEFARWGQSLASDADLLFYGCNLAANDEGQWLLDTISVLTGADVAASTDITGHERLGGDWQLEFSRGEITAPSAFTERTQTEWFGTLNSISFQDGTNGYASTVDTMVKNADATSNFSSTTLLTTQSQGDADEEQTLIRFDNLFGNAAGRIPYGSTITAAQLVVHVTDPADAGDAISAYRLLTSFMETSSWNTLNSGVQTDNVEATAIPVGTVASPTASGSVVISGLESTVQLWANGVPNQGLVLKKPGSNSWGFQSSETSTISQRPQLVVTYTPPNSLRVDTTADVLDGDTSSLSALIGNRGSDGKISLREAITAANNTSGLNEIELSAGTYQLSLDGLPDDGNLRGDLDITDGVKIIGAGSGATIVDGGSIDRVFDVLASGNTTLQDLTITNGSVDFSNGGGVRTNAATALTLKRVAVTNNAAFEGGGIDSRGTLQVIDSTISGNTALSFGGGLSLVGMASISGTTLSNNDATQGGGLAVMSTAMSMAITNSTITLNSSTTGGGAIHTHGNISISSSTIAGNTGSAGAGGIKVAPGGSASLQNSILSSNSGGNSESVLISNGHNIDSDGTAGLNQASDRNGLDPRLTALANHGGLTQTLALLPDSPAISTGLAPGLTTDQRGDARGSVSDIGAYQRASRLRSTTEQRVNATIADVQATTHESRNAAQSISIAPTGESVIVWSSNGQDGSNAGVYARRYSRFGSPLGGEFLINTTTSGMQNWSAIDHDALGRFVVTWTSSTQDGSDHGVYARLYEADGTARTGEILVNTTTSNAQKSPSLAVTADGSFVVAWEGEGNGDATGIFYRRFDSSGVALDTVERRVNVATSNSETRASIAINDDKDFVVVWDDSEDVWTQKYRWEGTPVGINTRVDGLLDNAHNAVVGMAADGSFVVAMEVSTVFFGEGIYAQRLTSFGDVNGLPILVNNTTSNDQIRPSIAVDTTGEFLISWTGNGAGDATGVFVRKFTEDGVAQGNESRINLTTSATQSDAAVTLLDAGNFAVVWSGNGPGDSNGVFYRVFGSDPVGAVIESTSAPIIDNTVDAVWNTTTINSIALTAAGAVTDANDLSATWQALWTNSGLYLLTTVTDDVIVTDSGSATFSDDIVEVFIDTDHSRHTSYDGTTDFHFGFRVGDTTPSLGANSVASTAGIVFTTTNVSPTSYRLEAMIPWTLLAVSPEQGQLIGFDVQVGDDDNGDTSDGKLAWADPVDQALVNPNLMATSELSGFALGNALPAAVANGPYVVIPNGSVTLSAAGSDDFDGTVTTYEWDFDYDGLTFDVDTTGNAPLFSATGLSAGQTRVVGLRVTDDQGAVSSVATADIHVVSDTLVNTTTTGAQSQVDVASNPAGHLIVVWEDSAADGQGSGILGQLYDEHRAPVGAEFIVTSTTTGNQSAPTVSMRDDGQFVVVWTSYGQSGDTAAEGNIYARLFDANGLALGSEFLVNETTNGQQHEAAVAYEFSDHHFMVVWSSIGQDGSGSGVYGRLFDANGSALSSEYLVNTTTTGDQSQPDVGGDEYDDFSVVWQSHDQDGSGWNIYEQRFRKGDSPFGSEILRNTTTSGDQYAPAVGMERDGDRYVVWTSDGQDGDGSGIFADHILYGGSGTNNLGEFRVNSTTAGGQSAAAIAFDENGAAVVTWQSTGQNGDTTSETNIYGQMYSLSAQRPQANGSEFLVNTFTSGSQSTPRVTAEFDGDYTIAWIGAGAADPDGVYWRHFEGALSNGEPEIRLSESTRSFTEGGAPLVLDAALVVTDPDNANLSSATISIRDNFVSGTDILTIGTQPGIATNFNSSTGSLTLSGVASVADYQAILRTVAYQNISENPDGLARRIGIAVSDGVADGDANLVIEVVAVNDAPTITSNGGGTTTNLSIAENATTTTTVTATDPESSPLSYSISGGVDSAQFVIDASSGILSFISSPDFEGPNDSNADNVYEVTVQVSDGTLFDSQQLSVTITNANDLAPIIPAGQLFSVLETASSGTSLGVVAATDSDGVTIFANWVITGGNSGGTFGINSSTGELTVTNPTSLNAALTPTYALTLTVSDGTQMAAEQTVVIAVQSTAPGAPVANDDNYSLSEGGTISQTVLGDWFNPSWKYRQRLTFDNSASSTDLIDTPVLVRLHASAADAVQIDYSHTQDAGQDVRFVDANGTLLAHEIEHWDESGYSFVWVHVPLIAGNSVSDFMEMYFGNPDALTGSNPTGVWRPSDVGVYHLNTTAIDSSSYGNDGGVSNVVMTTGKIGGAGFFDGATSFINAGSNASLDNIFTGGGTVSAWIRPTGWGENGYGRILDKAASTSTANGWAVQVEGSTPSDGRLLIEHDFNISAGRWRTVAGSVSLNSWQHVAVVYDNTSVLNQPRVFINGNEVAVTSLLPPLGIADSDATQNLYIGNRSGATDRTFSGEIDEVRLSTAALTPDEIEAQFKLGSNNFVTGGTVESGPGGLLNNDRDPMSQGLTVSLISGPTRAASFTLNADGSFQYTHDDSETATDSFTYQISNGMLTDFATVTLSISGVNDAPTITSLGGGATAALSVVENSATATTVTALDLDGPTQSLAYAINGGADAARFSIDPITGVLSFGTTPDFESPSDADADNVYQVIVRVSDGTLTDSQTLSVTVTADNDNAPVITSDGGTATAIINVIENQSMVTTVTATDADLPAPSLNYSIDGGVDATRFSINATTGVLSFLTAPNFEAPHDADANNVYEITVRVSDGLLANTQQISIAVTNANESPTMNSAALSVVENSTNGTLVGTVTATDVDDGDSRTFALISGNTNGAFALDSTTGQMTVANTAALNFETTPTFSLVLRVTDSGGLTSTTTTTVALTNANEVPTMNSGVFTLGENTESVTLVGTVNGSDPDVGDGLIYAIVGGNPDGAFAIHSITGQLTVANAAALDFEATPTFNLTLRATDAGGLSQIATTTISLSDVNDAPSASTTSFAIPENTADGTVVGTLVATDPDAGDSLTFAISDGNTGGAFAIHATTGVLSIANGSVLDLETTSSFHLSIRITDAGGLATDTTTTIALTNINEAPLMNSGALTIVENSANGTLIGTISASDPDAGDLQSYAIVSGNSKGAFTLDATTGRLSVANVAAMDFETMPNAPLLIRVTDRGGLSHDALMSVSLSNANEAPSIASSTFTVAENSVNGTSVGTVIAQDPDSFDGLSWSIISGNSGGAFHINAATGQISVANSVALNFEQVATFSLVIRATDTGGLSDTSTATIQLVDINESPVMDSATFGVLENSANGVAIGSATAFDPDVFDSRSFAIISGNSGGAFGIDAGTGAISVANRNILDFEATPQFQLVVRVTDSAGLTDTETINVNLHNINEAPTTIGQSDITLAEDTTLSLDLRPLFSDPESSDSALLLTAASSNAVVIIPSTVSGGVLMLTPRANASGTATITLTARDPNGLSVSTTFLLTVTPVDDAPVANADQYFVGTAELSVDAAHGVLVNDVEHDADPMTATLVSGPSVGSLTFYSDGSFEFTAPQNFLGSTTFIYAVSDGQFTTTNTVTLIGLAAPGPIGSGSTESPSNSTTGSSRDSGPTEISSPTSKTSSSIPSDHTSSEDNDSAVISPTVPHSGNTGGTVGVVPSTTNGSSSNNDDQQDSDDLIELSGVLLKKEEDTTASSDRTSSLGTSISTVRAGVFSGDELSTSLLASLRFDGEDMSYLADARFLTALDKAERQVSDSASHEMIISEWAAGGAIVTSTGLSVGYIMWIIRGGYVLASVVSTMPVWQNVDPLPVLDAFDRSDEDDESLESMIAKAEEGEPSSDAEL